MMRFGAVILLVCLLLAATRVAAQLNGDQPIGVFEMAEVDPARGIISGPSDRPDPAKLRSEKQRAKRNSVTLADPELRLLPGTHAIDSICTLKTVRGRLVLMTPLAKEERTHVQMVVEGLPELVSVIAEGTGEGLEFTLSTKNFGDAKAVSIDTEIQLESGTLSFTRAMRYLDGFLTVTFIQTTGDEEAESEASLSVIWQPQKGTPESRAASAHDFAALRRLHGEDVNRYVRPILVSMGLGSALNVELPQAFPVFASEWHPSHATRQAVLKLIPELDDEKPARRNAALQQLRQLGLDGALALIHLDRHSLSPEQNGRIDVLLAQMNTLSDSQRLRLRRDPHFLCDCLYSDDLRIASSAARHVEKLLGKPVEVDFTQPPVRRSSAVEALRERVLRVSP